MEIEDEELEAIEFKFVLSDGSPYNSPFIYQKKDEYLFYNLSPLLLPEPAIPIIYNI